MKLRLKGTIKYWKVGPLHTSLLLCTSISARSYFRTIQGLSIKARERRVTSSIRWVWFIARAKCGVVFVWRGAGCSVKLFSILTPGSRAGRAVLCVTWSPGRATWRSRNNRVLTALFKPYKVKPIKTKSFRSASEASNINSYLWIKNNCLFFICVCVAVTATKR